MATGQTGLPPGAGDLATIATVQAGGWWGDAEGTHPAVCEEKHGLAMAPT